MTREEAIAIIRKRYPFVSFSGTEFETALRNLIPELTESEDERNEKIRKQLISSFDYEMSKYGNVEWEKGISYREVIVWLEKQKEPKHAMYDLQKASEAGYEQTEKGFALTWQDIAKIDDMLREVENCVATSDLPTMSREEYYTEVLNRYNELKKNESKN